jgi:hypothetical protein
MNEKITVMLGIDMETDVGSFTPFYEGVRNGTPRLLEIFQKKGIAGTFYFTGDCARQNPKTVEMVKDSQNEAGCHSLFHETVGDELFPIPGEKPLLPEEVPFRLKKATEWVNEVLGERPKAFRCPRLWGSTAVTNALEELGYDTDASYPMYYYRERFAPYHPSKEDWTKEGTLRLLEIPNFADMAMVSKDPGLERDRDQWPLFRTKGAGALMQHIENYLGFMRERGEPAVLCFYFHPWEFIPCKRTYRYGESAVTPKRFITKGCGDRAIREFTVLIDRLKDKGANFVRAADLFGMYAGEQ